jgi:predicted Zn-dependent protease
MTKFTHTGKVIFTLSAVLMMSACSTNQATGRNQFTGLMPASQEAAIGASEHHKIVAQYGGVVKDTALQNYVTSVGNKIVPHTERGDVTYTFTLLDSPVVNAFALPGGYVYITRGILALANSEAELAAVMAHEIGHVTARHSAERYSTSVLTQLGTGILSTAIKMDVAYQILGLGQNLYLSSYSRSQEHEADNLGVKYLSRAGYDTAAMARFLGSLEASSVFDAKEAGKDSDATPSYFSTHPVTAERVSQSISETAKYPTEPANINRIEYLKAINGMVYGDSAAQGFTADGKFVHPDLGFKFDVPDNFKTQNTPSAFIAQSRTNGGGTMIFESKTKYPTQTPLDYLKQNVLKGDASSARDFGSNVINGMNSASFETTGIVGGNKTNIRVVAIEWDDKTIYQFTLALPSVGNNGDIQSLQNAVFSFQRLSSTDKSKYRPKRLGFRVAKAGDTVESLSANFPYRDGLNADRFRMINGMAPNAQPSANQAYKVISQ